MKSSAYLINIVLKKTMINPYILWTSRKPNLRYLWVWGTHVEAKRFRPNERKLHSQVVSYLIFRYSK